MDHEAKLYILVLLIIFGLPMTGLALDSYYKSNCRIELARAGKTAQEIVDVCK